MGTGISNGIATLLYVSWACLAEHPMCQIQCHTVGTPRTQQMTHALKQLTAFYSPGEKKAMKILAMKFSGSCDRCRTVRSGVGWSVLLEGSRKPAQRRSLLNYVGKEKL